MKEVTTGVREPASDPASLLQSSSTKCYYQMEIINTVCREQYYTQQDLEVSRYLGLMRGSATGSRARVAAIACQKLYIRAK